MEGPFSLSRRRFLAWVGAGRRRRRGVGWARRDWRRRCRRPRRRRCSQVPHRDPSARSARSTSPSAGQRSSSPAYTCLSAVRAPTSSPMTIALCAGWRSAILLPPHRLVPVHPLGAADQRADDSAARGDPLRHGSGHRPRGDRRRRAPAPHVGDAARRPRRRQPGGSPRPVRPAPHRCTRSGFQPRTPPRHPRGVGAGGPRRPGHLHRPEDGVQAPRGSSTWIPWRRASRSSS